jgi:predicted DNA-binding transcriptional regulator AlpA
MSEVFTTPQAADFVKLSVPTLNKLRTYGGGPPFIKLGTRRIAYLKSDLEEWLASCPRCVSTSDPATQDVKPFRSSEPRRRGRPRKPHDKPAAATATT